LFINELNELGVKRIAKMRIIAKLKKVIMKLRDFFSNCKWKLKAVKRAKEIKSLNKRIKELFVSRDKIKIKNEQLREKNKELENKLKGLEYELKKT